ncbi:MAG TPA: PA0069 family radical SAM protein [Steroidobacteraceae bacterium]|nr:PA0069 family radical SAM protein [Steroidobacteraceae bacterium]
MSSSRETRPLKGRGAVSNPEGRFESRQLESVDDGWYQEALPDSVATAVTPERAKSIITTNDSPDVGFEYSINPYRGCEHGCIYCLSGNTSILLANGATRPLRELEIGQEIYGTEKRGRDRRYVRTTVLAHWRTRKLAHRIMLADGTQLVASADHRFLAHDGWRFVAPNGDVSGPPYVTRQTPLMGLALGIRQRLSREARMIAASPPSLHRLALAADFEIRSSDSARLLRYFQLRGGRDSPRFSHSCGPSITQESLIDQQAVESPAGLRVVEIEPLGAELDLFDITTGTGDFVANGVVSHNCYARPAHSYMGLSPGLDFETKLFYKHDAADLLERELARPGYVCKPIMLGANTDPYQPVERRLEVTRGILAVLARCRHPVSVITKGALVTRDTDLLTDMARDDLASVAVSLTSLDAATKRTLEPRTASPEARLRVIRHLSEAGIPVSVMVAPVIPAITDHELERLLEAARDAGATTAAYVLLRLPYEVKTLFREWLAEHYPDRAQHVMSLVNELRGGRDNDPEFGTRMRGTGPYAELLRTRFQLACRRLGLNAARGGRLTTRHFRPPTPTGGQMGLDL